MPRYSKATQALKGTRLIKPYIKNGFNQSALARAEGVTQSAINQRLNQKPVQDILQKFLNSSKLKKTLIDVAKEGLHANKVISCNVISSDGEGMKDANSMTKDFVDVPDHQSRHKFWHDLMIGSGAIKTDGSKGVTIVNVVLGYRSTNSAIRQEVGAGEPT
jgi:predicted transcriptional regulator